MCASSEPCFAWLSPRIASGDCIISDDLYEYNPQQKRTCNDRNVCSILLKVVIKSLK